jgi:DNA-binding NarL/FixJ family response regulator
VIRVLLADDERLVRRGLRMILEADAAIRVIGEAADGAEAIDAAARLSPDVVLMDVRMPTTDGLEATRRIVALGSPAPRVIVLTTFDLDEYVFGALRAGASGFLLKDAPEEHLLSAIRVAAEGGSLFAPSATRRLVEAFARGPTVASEAATAVGSLTPRELEVLRLLAGGLTNAEIASSLGVSTHTAKTHVAHVLGKLGLRDRAQAVIVGYESGLVGGATA